MTTIFEYLQLSVVEHNWGQLKYMLSYISRSNDLSGSQHYREIIDVLEYFLFSIPNDDSENKHEMKEIVFLFLSCVDPCLVIPSLLMRHEQDSQYLTNNMSDNDSFEDLTIIHNLCMENKHEALKILLNQVHPKIASFEVGRSAFLSVDHAESDKLLHLDLFRTPMHAAWDGILFRCNIQEIFTKVQAPCDLNDEWMHLWKTSVYLLLAFDGKPLDLSLSESTFWNILHVIIRYGHRAHAAVMWTCLRLYPHLASLFDRNGDLSLHIACKQQLFNRCMPANKNHLGRTVSSTSTKDDAFSLSSFNPAPKLDELNEIQLEETRQWEQSTISMLLECYPFAASVTNREGRLPLHLLLMNNEDNKALLHLSEGGGNNGMQIMESLPDVKAMIEANPRALDSIDPVSGLHPFMLAAVSNTIPLDIVYFLLSESPIVLDGFTHNIIQLQPMKTY